MLSNIEHWSEFYNDTHGPVYPSQFSIFVHSWLKGLSANILEIGCGNGRDTIFFHQKGHNIIATDQVVSNSLLSYKQGNENIETYEGDISNVVKTLDKTFFLQKSVVYSRFFQHAIPQNIEEKLLENLSNLVSEETILFFEFRLNKDEKKQKEFGCDHYRRFQKSSDFVKLLEKNRFECIYKCKGTGYARYGEEDPYVGRFVVKKSNRKLKIVK